MTVRDLTILGCSSQQPTRRRNHNAYLVRWNEEGFLFDPGEGTQRQFIFANIAPTTITRIFISHFHGDHCLGLSSVLMRLNLDDVPHPIHVYYPGRGKKYFDRLRHCTQYHEHITIVEHPVYEEGLVDDDGHFRIEAAFLDHSVECLGWRITEPDKRKFSKEKLDAFGVRGPLVHQLKIEGKLTMNNQDVSLDDVSWIRKGDVLAVVIDTRKCSNILRLAQNAQLFLCESTYQEEHADLAYRHKHLTARQAAEFAKNAGAKQLVLTHFSARYLHTKGFLEEAQTIFPNTVVAEDMKQIPFLREE